MHKRSDKEFLLDILEACKRIRRYIDDISYEEFLKNEEKQDAVIHNIEIIGEAVKQLSDNIKNRYSEIEWKNIARMRDKIIHHYFGISLEIVWVVATKEIKELEEGINKILELQSNRP